MNAACRNILNTVNNKETSAYSAIVLQIGSDATRDWRHENNLIHMVEDGSRVRHSGFVTELSGDEDTCVT